MSRYGWNGYGPYVSKAEKIAKALKTKEKMAKKGVMLEPVIIEGRTISHTWWGQSWVKNLERYADYSNRLPRGRSYLRNGSILDLKISPNKITALVSGSRSAPYKIDISINSISKSAEAALMKKSRESLDSMQSLLAGEFPSELKDQFFEQGSGLFPSPKEIKLDCSCPDWATMCKHVAASLYGVAARLDQKPELFFTLRGIDINTFVVSVAKEESAKLLRKSNVHSERTLVSVESGEDMAQLFGITLESTDDNDVPEHIHNVKIIPATGKVVKKVTKKKTTAKLSATKTKMAQKKSDVNKPSVKKSVQKSVVKKVTKKKVAKKKAGRKKAGMDE